jgi:4-hydroxy-3-polyprenylbenzoate decarboxylase
MYKSLRTAAHDLEKHKMLIRLKTPLDADLEMAEVHRRIYDIGGPAILYENVKNSPFQAISNLYGTIDRTRFLFRHTLEKVQRVIEIKADPSVLFRKPLRYASAPLTALTALPMKALFSKPVLQHRTTIGQLPQIKSWSMDGGGFITLPQVFSQDPDKKGILNSNLGMYRIQLSGNDYIPNEEIGLHYQLHRGIGVHHTRYNELDKPFKVSIFVGGLPSHAFSAIMPLPEGLSELSFAGMLAARRFRYASWNEYTISTDADFCILGEIVKGVKKPEGPFGDHLGYYSLKHEFPVMRVEAVFHRPNPLWHFTVVGRPPQEDSSFGYLIHELVKELTPIEFPGLTSLHAVDVAGVHPLLLAIGKERYMPFRDKKPEEILTIANRILGTGQTSLAKYLWIASQNDNPTLDTHDTKAFFTHLLERVDWQRDLHFQTRTTIDTLDYSGSAWNEGSKLVIACSGDKKRTLSDQIPYGFNLPHGFEKPIFVQAGILAIQAKKYTDVLTELQSVTALTHYLEKYDWTTIPLIVLCDDSPFLTATWNNFLWVCFTRSNPSHDIYGVRATTLFKHWGCEGALIIDARIKTHHAPVLETDPKTVATIDKLFSKGGEVYEALKKIEA